MAENIHIDLSDEIEQDLLSRYQKVCQDLGQELSTMSQELQDICTQTQYEPMVNVVNSTIDLFDGDIYDIAVRAFDEWISGSGSFSAASKNSQAGSEALGTAAQIEANIRNEFDGFWGGHPLGETVQIDTSRPKIKSEDFDELKEIYTKYFQNIESLSEENINQIAEQGEDDPTYNVIIPAVKAITEPIKDAFEQFGTKIDDAKETSESLKQQQDTWNDAASETATQTSASAAQIAESLKMFDDI